MASLRTGTRVDFKNLDKNLEEVYAYQQLQDSDLENLSEFLGMGTSPTSLILSSLNPKSKLGPGLETLGLALLYNTTVTHLALENMSIAPEYLSSLFLALAKRHIPLSLSLKLTPISDSLLWELSRVESLFALNLYKCLRGQIEEAEAIAHILRSNYNLIHLNLGLNKINDEGLCLIAQGIKENRTLVELSLDYNPIRNLGVSCLAAALKEHPTIEKLSLVDSKIQDSGYEALSLFLGEPTCHLKFLDLGSNIYPILSDDAKVIGSGFHRDRSVSGRGLEYLGSALGVNASLQVLILPYNVEYPIYKGLDTIDKALDTNSTLIRLDGCLEKLCRPKDAGIIVCNSIFKKLQRNLANMKTKESRLFSSILEKIADSS